MKGCADRTVAPRCHSMLLLCTFAVVAMDTYAASDGEPGEGTADWPTNATPPFPPSYRTNDSTILYWRNGSGFEPTTTLTRYGLFLFDWAHAANVWINDYSPMDAVQCCKRNANR